MSLNSNTWYSIQSFGTDYNLAVGNSTSGAGSVFSQSDDQAPNALWQVNPSSGNSPSFLRAKQSGADFCLSGVNGQVSLVRCTSSAVWTIASFNGQDTSDGYFLSPGELASSSRLKEAPSGNAVSLQEYSASSSDAVYFQWAFRSVSAINDGSYSTVPGGSGSSTTATSSSSSVIVTSSSSSTNSTSSSTTSSSPTTTPQEETMTITHTADVTTTPVEPETSTVIVTRTNPTTTSGGSRTSSTPSVSPTTVPGSANMEGVSVRNVLVIGLLSIAIGLNIM